MRLAQAADMSPPGAVPAMAVLVGRWLASGSGEGSNESPTHPGSPSTTVCWPAAAACTTSQCCGLLQGSFSHPGSAEEPAGRSMVTTAWLMSLLPGWWIPPA